MDVIVSFNEKGNHFVVYKLCTQLDIVTTISCKYTKQCEKLVVYLLIVNDAQHGKAVVVSQH